MKEGARMSGYVKQTCAYCGGRGEREELVQMGPFGKHSLRVRCFHCNGDGYVFVKDEPVLEECPKCKGEGTVFRRSTRLIQTKSAFGGPVPTWNRVRCDSCSGKGRIPIR